ncbi:LysR family transcriptional regulator [Oxalobacteraceae bacterium CAVE-383]|nr:LysR family transcriptional regulator [Oxalobacteraceae bacterium CAVE-383]
MNISSRQLKAFLLTARLGNFTKAAEVMHLTQAGLSVMMRELETQLDARLFDRTTRTVTLTGAGEKFLPAAIRALSEIEDAAAQINAIGEKARHTLRIAATPFVSSNLMPPICRLFRTRYPEVAIQFVDCALKQVHALVENGEADLGFGFFFKASRGIERTLLHAFSLMRIAALDDADADAHADLAALRPGAMVAGKAPWSALESASLLALPADNPIQQLVETHLAAVRPRHEEKPAFNYFETLIAMTASGMGATVLPSLALIGCQRYPVRCDILVPRVSLGLHQISKRGRGKTPVMADFTATLIAELPGLMQTEHLARRSGSPGAIQA